MRPYAAGPCQGPWDLDMLGRVRWWPWGLVVRVGMVGFNKASMNSTREVGSIYRLVAGSKAPGVVILSTVSNAAGALIRVSSCLCGGGPRNTGGMVGGLRRGCVGRMRRLFTASGCGGGALSFLDSRFSCLHDFAGVLFASFRRGIVLTRNRVVDAGVMAGCLGRYNIGAVLLSTLSFVHASGGTRPSFGCVGRGVYRLVRTGPNCRVCVARKFVYHGTCNRISGLLHKNSSCATYLVNTTLGDRRVRV